VLGIEPKALLGMCSTAESHPIPHLFLQGKQQYRSTAPLPSSSELGQALSGRNLQGRRKKGPAQPMAHLYEERRGSTWFPELQSPVVLLGRES
jgi:hypothetical protein